MSEEKYIGHQFNPMWIDAETRAMPPSRRSPEMDYEKLADGFWGLVDPIDDRHKADLTEIYTALRAAAALEKTLTDLAYAADTAELLLRIMFPDEAASLRDKVTAAKAALTT